MPTHANKYMVLKMASDKDLDAKLAELQELGVEYYRDKETARRKLHRTLVETYFWWRSASQKQGYLEKQFEAAKINPKPNKLNRPHFNPVLNLVFKEENHSAAKISGWSKALNAIDDEYLRNLHIYKHRDAVAELIDWMNDKGGVKGVRSLAGYDLDENGNDNIEVASKVATGPKKKKILTEQKKKQQFEVLGLKKLSISQSLDTQTFDVGPVGTGDDDLVVVLAKATGNGNELRVVGTTAQQGLVDSAVMNIGEVDFANAPAQLRMLCEAIKLNTIPKALQSYGARPNFYNKSKLEVYEEGAKKPTKLRENARLVLQRNGTILVSKSYSQASLTTYYIPNVKFAVDEDIFLRGRDRYWLETELINESEIVLYDATDLEPQTNKKLTATHQITLKNTLSKQKRNLYFYSFSRVDDTTLCQPAIVDEKINYDWAIKGNVSYFRRLYEQHFEGWQHRVKHRVHTANNKAVAFEVSEDGITCEKKWDKIGACFMQAGPRYLTAFSDDAETCGTGRIVFAPTDIIAALQMISQHKVKDDLVMMSGNEDLLFINYNNELAEVQIYIPSCTIAGKRNSTYFTKFIANE